MSSTSSSSLSACVINSVLIALKNLNERDGSSALDILEHMKSDNGASRLKIKPHNLVIHMQRALGMGVRGGHIVNNNGRYKIAYKKVKKRLNNNPSNTSSDVRSVKHSQPSPNKSLHTCSKHEIPSQPTPEQRKSSARLTIDLPTSASTITLTTDIQRLDDNVFKSISTVHIAGDSANGNQREDYECDDENCICHIHPFSRDSSPLTHSSLCNATAD